MDTNLEQLYKDVQIAFDKSDIKRYAESNNHQWNYSLSSTSLKTGTILLIGFNWGASNADNYFPQIDQPTDSFKELLDKGNLGSFGRIYPYLKKYFPDEADNAIQTNFCFFRSKTEDQITTKDLELSTPLFETLINMTEPKIIIGFSGKLKNYLISSKQISELKKTALQSNKITLYVEKGQYKNKEIFFLPHPNSHFTTDARNAAWEFCFLNS